MARINNPRKQFQFTVIIPGINPFTVQSFKTADLEIEADEHGETNYKVKTPGMVSYGMITISKISPVDGLDDYAYQWSKQCANSITGGGFLPSVVKRIIIVEQLGNDGITVVKRWTYEGCWPRRLNGIEFNRVQSGNTVEQIEFEVDRQID